MDEYTPDPVATVGEPEAIHPSQETRVFHPQDVFLRRHGYRIEHRPKDSEPIWSLAGQEHTQSQALELCDDARALGVLLSQCVLPT